MTTLRLLALSVLFFSFSSCKKDDSRQSSADQRYVNNFFLLSGAEVVPANSSSGTATFTGTLDRSTKLYTYTLTWKDLSSNVAAIHIHGLGEKGYIALPTPLGPYANGLVQNVTGFTAAKSGSITSSFTVDGVVIKESDLLNGRFYVDIHTVNFPTSGEVRGQIAFPR